MFFKIVKTFIIPNANVKILFFAFEKYRHMFLLNRKLKAFIGNLYTSFQVDKHIVR